MTYDGRKLHARVLQCIDTAQQYVHTNETLYPSQRYMNILISGATEHRLDQNYITWLQQQPTQQKHMLLYCMWIIITLLHIILLIPIFILITLYYMILHQMNKIKPVIILTLIRSLWIYHRIYNRLIPHKHIPAQMYFKTNHDKRTIK